MNREFNQSYIKTFLEKSNLFMKNQLTKKYSELSPHPVL